MNLGLVDHPPTAGPPASLLERTAELTAEHRGAGNGLCELGVRVKDSAGNASEGSKRFVALR